MVSRGRSFHVCSNNYDQLRIGKLLVRGLEIIQKRPCFVKGTFVTWCGCMPEDHWLLVMRMLRHGYAFGYFLFSLISKSVFLSCAGWGIQSSSSGSSSEILLLGRAYRQPLLQAHTRWRGEFSAPFRLWEVSAHGSSVQDTNSAVCLVCSRKSSVRGNCCSDFWTSLCISLLW